MALRLNILFKDKDEAKEKGAFWDNEAKTWFVPKHKDYNSFSKWIDQEKYSIIAPTPFMVALNTRECWKCFNSTRMIALASNNFFEKDYASEDSEDETMKWYQQDYFTFFSTPTDINHDTVNIITKVFPFFKVGYSKKGGSYWANHCHHCSAIQGDFFNHNEQGGAFNPLTIEECKKLVLIKVSAKFDLTLNAGLQWSSMEANILKYAQKKDWSFLK